MICVFDGEFTDSSTCTVFHAIHLKNQNTKFTYKFKNYVTASSKDISLRQVDCFVKQLFY